MNRKSPWLISRLYARILRPCSAIRSMLRVWLCLFLCLPLLSLAHPHVFITIQVEPELNSDNNIIALRQHWVFDPLFSALWLEPLEKAPAQAVEKEKQESLLAALQAQHFYLHSAAEFQAVEVQRLYAQAQELHLELRLPLAVAQSRVAYKMYEPAYYIELLHQPNHQAHFGACSWRLVPQEQAKPALPPEPLDLRLATNMAEAAKNPLPLAAAPADIGQYFAEEAEFSCL